MAGVGLEAESANVRADGYFSVQVGILSEVVGSCSAGHFLRLDVLRGARYVLAARTDVGGLIGMGSR